MEGHMLPKKMRTPRVSDAIQYPLSYDAMLLSFNVTNLNSAC